VSLFKLHQNYPNPVNTNARISYELPSGVFVTLKVYDSQGREVATLVNGLQDAGSQSAEFNVFNLQSGVYFYKIDAGKYHDSKKLIILK
jgi:hypothetical protein